MVVHYSHLQTCKEYWNSGDKRINESIAEMIHDQHERKEDATQGSGTHDGSYRAELKHPTLLLVSFERLGKQGMHMRTTKKPRRHPYLDPICAPAKMS